MEIETVGEYGAPIFINLEYHDTILQAMRDVLKNDRDIFESKIAQGDRIITSSEYNAKTNNILGTWNVYINEKSWGRITFGWLMGGCSYTN